MNNPFEAMNYACDHSQKELAQMSQNESPYQDMNKYAEYFNSPEKSPVLFYPTTNTSYISPYMYDNWGGVSGIIASLNEDSKMGQLQQEQKIDPNKIYTSELSSLRAAAADQVRIIKFFEKKFMDTAKNNQNLTENDILAMQSLTAARQALTSIAKEIIGVKKNISELRLKQQQMNNQSMRGNVDGGIVPTTSASNMNTTAFLDEIFSSNAANVVDVDRVIADMSPEQLQSDITSAEAIIDNITGGDSSIDAYTEYEHLNPKTFVVVDENDDNPEYVTLSNFGNGEVIPDYPKPVANIVSINRDTNTAIDSTERSYPIINK